MARFTAFTQRVNWNSNKKDMSPFFMLDIGGTVVRQFSVGIQECSKSDYILERS